MTVDSLRYGNLILDKKTSEQNDTLTRIFHDGCTLAKSHATGPGTTPSFPALLTGTMPLSFGGLGPLSGGRPRISNQLRSASLATGAFHCNPFLSRHFSYNVGFDEFHDYQNPLMGIATRIFPRGIEINNPRLRRIDDTLHLTDAIKMAYQLVKGKPRPYVSAEVITDDTIDWLSRTDDPFFCWTHYMDVHHPCFPPREYREVHDVAQANQTDVSEWYSALLRHPETLTDEEIADLKRLYEAAIDYTLDQAERILDHLDETDRLDDTLVILTSDHGELFGEHGQYGKPERMYDELLHVPLVVANGPDYLEDAAADLVSLLDVPPLIHDALGLEVPGEYEGRIPGKEPPREYVMAEHEVGGDVIVGARSEDWLYEGDEIQDEHRLFDLRDGFEQVDVSHPGGELVRTAVLERLDELDVEARYLQNELEGTVSDRLEDLGYL